MSKGGKAALVAGACLLALAGVGTGLYFGVSAIREKVDGALKAGSGITLVDLYKKDLKNLSDGEKEFLAEKDGKAAFDTVATGKDAELVSDVRFDVQPGDQFAYAKTITRTAGTLAMKLSGIASVSTASVDLAGAFSYSTCTLASRKLDVAFSLFIPAEEAGTIDAVCVYRISDFGFKSKAKNVFVFEKLISLVKEVNGDLAFKRDQVLKYASVYDDQEAAKAMSADSSVASSSAAA